MKWDEIKKRLQRKLEKQEDFYEKNFLYRHLVNVFENAKMILGKIDREIDKKLVLSAALLHDIGSIKEGDHTEEVKPVIENLFGDIFSEKEIEKIEEIIQSHMDKEEEPDSLEAKIVQDADQLDHIGRWAVVRSFMYGLFENRDVEDTIDYLHKNEKYVKEKILKKQINLEVSEEVVRKKAKEMYNLLSNLEKELFLK